MYGEVRVLLRKCLGAFAGAELGVSLHKLNPGPGPGSFVLDLINLLLLLLRAPGCTLGALVGVLADLGGRLLFGIGGFLIILGYTQDCTTLYTLAGLRFGQLVA